MADYERREFMMPGNACRLGEKKNVLYRRNL